METYHDLFVFLITVVIAFLGMGVIQWLKIKLGIEDKLATVLAVVVSLILAVGELFLTGTLAGGEPWAIANLPATLTGIFSLATIFYQLLLAGPVNARMVADQASG